MRTSPRRRCPDNLRAIGTSGNIMDSEKKAQTIHQNTRNYLAGKNNTAELPNSNMH
jgi:hypothetical protein